jgi:hypothetical protein
MGEFPVGLEVLGGSLDADTGSHWLGRVTWLIVVVMGAAMTKRGRGSGRRVEAV